MRNLYGTALTKCSSSGSVLFVKLLACFSFGDLETYKAVSMEFFISKAFRPSPAALLQMLFVITALV